MPSVTLRVRRLTPDATVPFIAHPGDAGLDLFASGEVTIPSGETRLVPTGIAIELPPRTEAQVRPRSGLALKHQLTVLNSPGTIDEGYRGEIGIIMINHGKRDFHVEKGMKIAQMVVKPVLDVVVEEVQELSGTVRGAGGFGSTGH